MKVSGPWLTAPPTVSVCNMLVEAGYKALFVGGCVRNAIIGRSVDDIDIATDALPAAVCEAAEVIGLRAVPTGIAHGTITVIADGIPHEITTFRRDVEAFGRQARVEFSTRVEDDASRRDFTMNALYATPDGHVIDPLGGLPDLLSGIVRFVGDPYDRIAEDYLRILRFFRFNALYADPLHGIDPSGLSACADLSEGIELLSRERIGAEMRKLLSAPDPAPAVAAMEASGVLARVLPGATSVALAPLVHLENGLVPCMLRRLAVLGGADAPERLRLSRNEARILEQIASAVASASSGAELGYRLGSDRARDAILVRAAVTGWAPGEDWQAQIAIGASAEFPVSASDLMPDFQGPELGKRLQALEQRWIGSGFSLSRDDLIG